MRKGWCPIRCVEHSTLGKPTACLVWDIAQERRDRTSTAVRQELDYRPIPSVMAGETDTAGTATERAHRLIVYCQHRPSLAVGLDFAVPSEKVSLGVSNVAFCMHSHEISFGETTVRDSQPESQEAQALVNIIEVVTDTLKISDYMVGVTRRDGKVVGFAESRRLDGRAADAALAPDGTMVYRFFGKPFQNEQDTLVSCRTLVAVLNEQGAEWGEPERVEEQNIDVVCQQRIGEGERLAIQVVRSQVDRLFWKEAANAAVDNRPAERQADMAGIVEELKAAIEHKCANISGEKRRGILLLLNAIDSPAHAFDDVVACFKDRYGSWAGTLGFSEIWVVGPLTDLVYRLSPAAD